MTGNYSKHWRCSSEQKEQKCSHGTSNLLEGRYLISEKYKVWKGKGILNRVNREGITQEYNGRPKGDWAYLGEEKCKQRKGEEREDNEIKKERVPSSRSCHLWALAVRCSVVAFVFYFFLQMRWEDITRFWTEKWLSLTFSKNPSWLLHGEGHIWDILIVKKKKIVVYLTFSFNRVSCIFICWMGQPSLGHCNYPRRRWCRHSVRTTEVMRNDQIMGICRRNSQLNFLIGFQ